MLQMGTLLAAVAFATLAPAEEKPATAPAQGGVITTAPIKIALRAPRPQAATEITRTAVARPLADLKKPLLDRVEKVIEKAPF